MTNSRNKAIYLPRHIHVPVTIYPTIPWQFKIWSVLFQYAPHMHDDVSLSSPLKGIERKILQLLPVSEVLYSTDLTYILSLHAEKAASGWCDLTRQLIVENPKREWRRCTDILFRKYL